MRGSEPGGGLPPHTHKHTHVLPHAHTSRNCHSFISQLSIVVTAQRGSPEGRHKRGGREKKKNSAQILKVSLQCVSRVKRRGGEACTSPRPHAPGDLPPRSQPPSAPRIRPLTPATTTNLNEGKIPFGRCPPPLPRRPQRGPPSCLLCLFAGLRPLGLFGSCGAPLLP